MKFVMSMTIEMDINENDLSTEKSKTIDERFDNGSVKLRELGVFVEDNEGNTIEQLSDDIAKEIFKKFNKRA